jgi:microcystin degradation protein MlrC
VEALKTKRLFVSGLFHETNTFVEQPTELESFQIIRDEAILQLRGNDSPMDGLLQTALDFGWEVRPGVVYSARPSGPLRDEIFELYWSELQPRLEAALAAGIDGIFLILHGAMATENLPDVEGELMRRIREIPGTESLPLFAVLDLHANVSELMARNATALIPYRVNPHTDARETAVRGAKLLRRVWAENLQVHTHYLHSRILLAPPSTGTANDPMRTLQQRARALEETAGHLEIGVAAGFAHADTPDTGLTFWVVSTQPEITCTRSLESLLQEARHLSRQSLAQEWELDDAIQKIATDRQFPALLVEPADNIGGGTAGDATFILRALLESPFEKCGVIINDPEAVTRLQTVTPGSTLRLPIGGRGSSADPGPVELDVTLVRLTDGNFVLEDKQSHLASLHGSHIVMGPSAVVTAGNVTILLTSRATPPFDLGQWRSQGVEPTELQVIGVKAAVGHRRAYDRVARSSFTVRTPGPGTSDLFALPYRKIRRPIYPLDP